MQKLIKYKDLKMIKFKLLMNQYNNKYRQKGKKEELKRNQQGLEGKQEGQAGKQIGQVGKQIDFLVEYFERRKLNA